MSTDIKDTILKIILNHARDRLDGQDVKIVIEFLKAMIKDNKIAPRNPEDVIDKFTKAINRKPETTRHNYTIPTGLDYVDNEYMLVINRDNRKITIEVSPVNERLSIFCTRDTAIFDITSKYLVDELLKHGILRRDNINETSIINTEKFLKSLDELENELSDKIIIAQQIAHDTPSYYFLKKDNTLTRLDKYGKTINAGTKKYLIIPKSIITQHQLVLRIEIAINTITDIQESRASLGNKQTKKILVTLSFRWVDPQTLIDPCKYVDTKAHPEELAYYHVEPEDKIRLDKNALELIRKANDNNILNTLRLLNNIFELPHIEEPSKEPSLHKELQEILVELGNALGLEPIMEFDVGSFRIDVAWLDEGKLIYAFEIVIGGSVLEALYRLEHVEAENKVLVISDERLGEVEGKVSEDIKVIPASAIINKKRREIIKQIFCNPQKKLHESIDTADSLNSVYEYLGR
jgi:hypothetical protein